MQKIRFSIYTDETLRAGVHSLYKIDKHINHLNIYAHELVYVQRI